MGSGDHLAVLTAAELILVNVKTDEVATYREPGSTGIMRVTLSAATFLSDTSVLLGDGRGTLRLMGPKGSENLEEICKVSPGDERSRVKALARASNKFAVGTSNGSVEIWQVNASAWGTSAAKTSDFTQLRVVDTGARLTCMMMWQGNVDSTGAKDAASTEVATKVHPRKKRKKLTKA